MDYGTVVNFNQWVLDVLPELRPPVGNKLLFGKGQLKVMIVGGPNTREDYHIEEGEEMFYMIKGDMCLKVIEQGKHRDIVIREGEIFMLPAKIPHSPQRQADTIGLVIERERVPQEKDGLRWYVPNTEEILYEEWFHCEDLGTQLKPIIERFFASEAYASKKPVQCYDVSQQPYQIDEKTILGSPFSLDKWCDEIMDQQSNTLFGIKSDQLRISEESLEKRPINANAPHALITSEPHPEHMSVNGEFQVDILGKDGMEMWNTENKSSAETLVWQLKGSVRITLSPAEETTANTIELSAGHMILFPPQSKLQVIPTSTDCRCILIRSLKFE